MGAVLAIDKAGKLLSIFYLYSRIIQSRHQVVLVRYEDFTKLW